MIERGGVPCEKGETELLMEKMINVIECGAEKARRLPEDQRRGLIDVGCGGWRQDESGQNCAPVCWCLDPEMRREERNVVAFGCHFLSAGTAEEIVSTIMPVWDWREPGPKYSVAVGLFRSSIQEFHSRPLGLLGFRDIRTAGKGRTH